MKVAITGRASELKERLRDRLAQAEQLRCAEHGQPVTALTIYALENGWFDSTWTTCCSALEREATSILKARC